MKLKKLIFTIQTKETRPKAGLMEPHVQTKFHLLIAMLYCFSFTNTFSQDGVNKVLIEISRSVIHNNEESIKGISAFVSKDTVVFYQNDFLNDEINAKILNYIEDLRTKLKKNEGISFTVFNNYFVFLQKEVSLRNIEKSIEVLTKYSDYFTFRFIDLNKAISVVN